jgi:toxin-antitoxin system PIN domain toxin
MIAVDTNILVYAHRRDCPWHAQARDVLAQLAQGRRPWAIPWPCVYEFLNITTHPRIYAAPSQLRQAMAQVQAWVDAPAMTLIGEGPRHWATLGNIFSAARAAGPLIHDAKIAAIALAHSVSELWTADRDFSRFPGLSVRNPLIR